MPINDVSAKIAAGGRIVIPANFRRELGVEVGDEILLRLDEGEVRILKRDQAIRKAQAMVRKSVPKGRSLVQELLAERRRAARHE
jgi:AbrB family looped-hinge helix DNA binding protein